MHRSLVVLVMLACSNTFAQNSHEPITNNVRIRVLQEQSVPYIQQADGSVSTSCNVAGTAGTSMRAARMDCGSYDGAIQWPYMLTAMLVEASDGNAYLIACDLAGRWSKCVPLRPGKVYNTRLSAEGMVVQFFNTKGGQPELIYKLLH
jgi:hypothetical protein